MELVIDRILEETPTMSEAELDAEEMETAWRKGQKEPCDLQSEL